MRRANESLRTACRTKPDTIRNWSALVFWRKQAFLTTLNQNSVSCQLHLTLTCIYLGRSAHVVPILPAAREDPGSHTWPGTVWDWKSWEMFGKEQTHHPSLRAASVWLCIPCCCLAHTDRDTPAGSAAHGRNPASSWPHLHPSCPPCMPEEAWRRTMVSIRGLPMGKEQGTSLEVLPPLPAPSSCYCLPCGQSGQPNAAQSLKH